MENNPPLDMSQMCGKDGISNSIFLGDEEIMTHEQFENA